MQRLPAKTCMLCGRTLEEIGGRRLAGTSSAFNGLVLSEREDVGRGGSRAIPITPDAEGKRFMVVWGEAWTEASIGAARESVERGERPWMCMKCGNRVCQECGWILTVPHHATVVRDDGSTGWHPVIPTSRLCSNPSCRLYRRGPVEGSEG